MTTMKTRVKFLTVTEIEVDSAADVAVEEAQAKLDAFREATQPSLEYGVTIYRATLADLSDELLSRQVELMDDEEDGARS